MPLKSHVKRWWAFETPYWWYAARHPIKNLLAGAVRLESLTEKDRITWSIMGPSINGDFVDIYYARKIWKPK